ncbi:hypothetical protein PQX77_010367 [Marasmius sp. AFHP31]|nr:hypothetical protein PQX77_010367 [Marasmius sp. AFHP31]
MYESSSSSRPPKKRSTPGFRSTVTPDERKTILHAIEEAEKEMKGYDAEINRLKASIVLLEGKRNRLSSTVTKYRASLSLVHRLPPEILAEIFKECCFEASYASNRPSFPPSSVVLSTVCGRWREVALSTAALWSSISINTSFWPPLKHEKLFRATQMLISRSKRHPLTIRFRSFFNHTTDVMKLLIQNCDRWYDVELALSRRILGHYVFHDIQGKVPLLKELTLSCSGEGPVDEPLDVFRDAPALRTLRLSSTMVSPKVILPWHQIHSLILEGCTNSQLYSTLLLFPHTRNIEITEVISDEDVSIPGSSILSNARMLYISINYDDELTLLDHLFTFLELPKLQTIRIHQLESDGHWDGTPLRECLLKSSCIVTSLRFDGLPISDEHMISLLQLLPNLELLHLQEPSLSSPQNMIVTHRFLQRLTAHSEFRDWEVAESSSGSGVMIPRLKDLTLSIYSVPLDQQALVDAITSRWIPDEDPLLNGGLRSLRKICLIVDVLDEDSSSKDEVDFGPLLSLKCFTDVGLDVNIEIR